MIQELIEDFREATAAMPEEHPKRRAVKLLGQALQLSAHVLAEDPLQLCSQLHGRFNGEDDAAIAALRAAVGPTDCRNPMLAEAACIFRCPSKRAAVDAAVAWAQRWCADPPIFSRLPHAGNSGRRGLGTSLDWAAMHRGVKHWKHRLTASGRGRIMLTAGGGRRQAGIRQMSAYSRAGGRGRVVLPPVSSTSQENLE